MPDRISAIIQCLLVLGFLTFQSPAVAAFYAVCGSECQAEGEVGVESRSHKGEIGARPCCCPAVEGSELDLPREVPQCCALHTFLGDFAPGSMALTTPLDHSAPAPVRIGQVAEFSWAGVPLAQGRGITNKEPRPLDPVLALRMRGVQLL